MRIEDIAYDVDGTWMIGRLALDETAFEGEMRDAGVADWRLEIYGGVGHSFTSTAADDLGPPFGHHPAAERRSWRSMLNLFDEVL